MRGELNRTLEDNVSIRIANVWKWAVIYAFIAIGVTVGHAVMSGEMPWTLLTVTCNTVFFFSGALTVRSIKGD